jgi:hypothetical protein
VVDAALPVEGHEVVFDLEQLHGGECRLGTVPSSARGGVEEDDASVGEEALGDPCNGDRVEPVSRPSGNA